jgi:hypothetical protein
MNYKLFDKDEFLPFLRRYRFEDIEDAAFVKIVFTIEVLIYNLINNALYVTEALKVKTIKRKHFDGVVQIMRDFENGMTKNPNLNLKGGNGTALPAEYFGVDSGRYFEQSMLKGGNGTALPSEYFGFDSGRYFASVDFNNTSYMDGMTRGPLMSTMEPGVIGMTGGGMTAGSFLTDKQVRIFIDNYKKEHKLDFKVATEVYQLLIASVVSNLSNLLKACSDKASKSKKPILTTAHLYSVLEKNGKQFAHMSYVWKTK